MIARILVSYDGTPNDDDALALAQRLAPVCDSLALAYVRHSQEFDPQREELAAHDARTRLEQGAAWLGHPEIEQHVVISPSTWEGLAALAAKISAQVVVFGSDYRTSPGTVSPGTTAQHLLEGGPVAVAVAPAGIRTVPRAQISLVAVAFGEATPDSGAAETAAMLADKLGARVGDDVSAADLLIVASGSGGPPGQVRLSGTARNGLGAARAPVLVLPAGATLA